MKKNFLISFFLLLCCINISIAQYVYSCKSTVNIRLGDCTTDTTLGTVPIGQSFFVDSTTPTSCGYTWYQMDIPSAHTKSPTTAYAAATYFNISLTPNNYLTVRGSSPGLLIHNSPEGPHTWIYYAGEPNYASFENGQKLALTSASPSKIGVDTWYQVYLTPNCYDTTTGGGGTQVLTGWVSNGISSGYGPLVVPYGCSNSTAPTLISVSSAGSSYTLTVSGGALGTGASWNWYSGSCGGTSLGTGSSITVSPSSITTYYVRAEGTCYTTYTLCASTIITPCTPPSPPTVSASIITDSSFYANWSSVSGASSYYLEIATNPSFISPFISGAVGSKTSYYVSGLSCGTTYYYHVKAVNSCGSSGYASVPVTTSACCTSPYAVSVSGGGSYCSGTTAHLYASGGSGGTIYYQGTTSGGTSTSYPYSSWPITASGTYYFRSWAGGSCWGPEGYATVTFNPLPSAVTVSGGGSFSGSTTLIASNGGSGTIYYQGTTSGGTCTTCGGSSYSVSSSGTYYFRALSTSGCWGDEGYATVSIGSIPAAGFSFTSGPLKVGESTATNNTSSGTITGYTWTVNPTSGVSPATSSVATPTFSFSKANIYTVSLTVHNEYGDNTTTKTIIVNAQPTASHESTSGKSPQTSDPINLATGIYNYNHTDFNIRAVNSYLNFTRYYSTVNAARNSTLGFGWSHSYDYQITNYGDSLWDVHYGDGHNSTFLPLTGGSGTSFSLFADTYEKLFRDPGTRKYVLAFKTGETYNFDSTGRLDTISDLNGNVTTLNYTSGSSMSENLTTVMAPGGRSLHLAYSGSKLISISDPLGRTVVIDTDANGNLFHATDHGSGVTQFFYDSLHLMTRIIRPRGDTLLTNVYDTFNRVITQYDALNQATIISYNTPDSGYVFVTKPGSHTITAKYNRSYSKILEIDELGYIKSYGYDSANNVIADTNENGDTNAYIYDSLGNCISILNAESAVTQLSYNTLCRPIKITDPLGNFDSLLYDSHYNLSVIQLPNGGTKSFTYYANGLDSSMTDANGNVTLFNYNSFGDLTSVVTPSGTRYFSYDSSGRKVSQTDENGYVTTFTYNNNDMVVLVTDAYGQTIKDSFDADNNLVLETDKRGISTAYNYDSKNRVSSITDATGGTQYFYYDSSDNINQITDANTHNTYFTYDHRNRVLSISNSITTIHNAYDPVGNKISETDSLGHTKYFGYDVVNRLITSVDGMGDTAHYTYYTTGRLKKVTDPMGRGTQYHYTSIGMLDTVKDAFNHTTTIGYDANGNQVSIFDPNRHNKSIVYDASNRVKKITNADNNVDSFSYDAVGNVVLETKPTGTISKDYDSLNRLKHVINSPGDKCTYTYDQNNNINSITNKTGTSYFNYDSLNRPIQYTDMFGKTVGYQYDHVGNRTAIFYPGGNTVTYIYNNADLLTSVSDWLSHTTTYYYDENGMLKYMLYPKGDTCFYVFDSANRITMQGNSSPATGIINKSIFTLNANGARIGEQRTGSIPFHLTAASLIDSFSADNKLTSVSGTTYTNDASGNRVDAGGTTYTFSVDNLLNSINASTGNTTFLYDAFGDRVGKENSTGAIRYVLDVTSGLSQVLQETDSTSAVRANYIYGLGLIARIDSTGYTQYYHYDAMHNTVALSNDSGKITDTYTYDPFGVLLKHIGTSQQPYTFLGQFGVQQETPSLYFARARYYDAANGRFLSPDKHPASIGNPQTLNQYVYGLNNPASIFDPSGLLGNGDNNISSNITFPFWSSFNNVMSNPQIINNAVNNFPSMINNYFSSNNQPIKIQKNTLNNNSINYQNNLNIPKFWFGVYDNTIAPISPDFLGPIGILAKSKYQKNYDGSFEQAIDLSTIQVMSNSTLPKLIGTEAEAQGINISGEYITTWIGSFLNFLGSIP